MTRKVYRRGRDGISPISEQNSTDTLLSVAGKFTGAADDINDFSSASISVFTDTPSATEGLVLEGSTDNVTWFVLGKLTVPAGVLFTHELNLFVRFFRLSYLTSGVQTSFTLQTVYRERPAQEPSVALAAAIADAIEQEVQNDQLQELKEIKMLLRLNNAYLSELTESYLQLIDLPVDDDN